MIHGEMINPRVVEGHDAPLLRRCFIDPLVMRGLGVERCGLLLARGRGSTGRVVAREAALGRPEALVAESLEGDPIGLVVLRIARLEARPEEDNERALALFRRLGFREDGRLRRGAYHDGRHANILLYGLLASQRTAQEEPEPITHS